VLASRNLAVFMLPVTAHVPDVAGEATAAGAPTARVSTARGRRNRKGDRTYLTPFRLFTCGN
jgi:hypothetical protein